MSLYENLDVMKYNLGIDKIDDEVGSNYDSDDSDGDDAAIDEMRKEMNEKKALGGPRAATIDIDTLPLSKELLEREKKYIELNKRIQTKSKQLVKQADETMKGGKELLERPVTTSPAPFAIAAELDSIRESPSSRQKSRPLTAPSSRKPTANRGSKPDEGINGFKDSSDAVLQPGEDESISETTTRILKAKVSVMQQELNKMMSERNVKDTSMAILEEKLKLMETENSKLTKQVSTLQNQYEKTKSQNEDLKKKNELYESELSSLKKSLDSVSRNSKQSESEANSKDVRLNRALEEIERLKAAIAKANAEAKEKLEISKLNADKLHQELKKNERQKADLMLGFKKQMQLIDLLKRQKMHIESTRLLEFTEEEFMRALK
ncbi:Golgin sub A member 2 [Nowakowskiella sp. JEL0407]|nr:Golgin sub A member 2 [Nowakowskiella sp. JEL0407]